MMKKLFLIFALVMLLMLPAMAEITADMTVDRNVTAGVVYTFATATDSIENDTSRVWSLNETITMFTESDSNKLEIPWGYHFNSDSGNVKISMKIQGSFDYDPSDSSGTWIDAITIADSVTSETATNGVANFGLERFPYYRTISDGLATNNPYTTCEFWMFVPWQ